MAKRHALIAVCLFALAAGCQGRKQVSMVDPLPPPHMGGPVLAPAGAPPAKLTPGPKASAHERVVAPPAVVPAAPVASAIMPAGIPRGWVPAAAPNRWQWIVIHHSATPIGGAARFGREHKAKGWDELGYHFVIGNGTDTAPGVVEVGPRWSRQKWGAHAKTADNRFNEHGIGICLVGNFDQTRPSDAQMKSLSKLVAHLMKTYRVPASRIIGHGDTKATECPGRNLSIAAVRRQAAQTLAASDDAVPPEPTRTASAGELLSNRGGAGTRVR